ncbi:hypothetical protein WJX74_000089 [Apatococcus lobatus]|uniref:peptide-methionine (S)-S-oxide reductase n=1 Tax=Apatococcus lobatus TaxID=904363 RepID=A0AAW1RAM7_9CHLO
MASSSSSPTRLETATFGMGCFWSPDALFSKVEGVVKTSVGYTGGDNPEPTYNTVCSNDGHTEAIKVVYDPSKVTYEELLQTFIKNHDPSRASGKAQYKSAIWTHDESQQAAVQKLLQDYSDGHNGKQVATAASLLACSQEYLESLKDLDAGQLPACSPKEPVDCHILSREALQYIAGSPKVERLSIWP